MIKLVKQNYSKNIELFNKTKKEIEEILKEKAPIDHVGSTAIPNMYGKNIIDILIGAANDAEMEEITEKLIKNNYFVSKSNKGDVYRFFSSTKAETKSGDIHIHLALIDTQIYIEFLILKNYLLKNEKEVKEYSEFKNFLIESKINDRREYKTIKSKYVTDLLLRAINDSKDK